MLSMHYSFPLLMLRILCIAMMYLFIQNFRCDFLGHIMILHLLCLMSILDHTGPTNFKVSVKYLRCIPAVASSEYPELGSFFFVSQTLRFHLHVLLLIMCC